MTNYNKSIIHSENLDLSPIEVWNIISEKSNLEHYHPFCKSNTPIEWNNKNHSDKLEYLNGMVFERHFVSWIKNEGYDLYIGRKNGRKSHVSWRIKRISDNQTELSIKVHPWIFNQGNRFIEFIPFEFFVRPRLKSYLQSVLGGLKWYVDNQKPTPRNHFGKIRWFS
tara:strand:+ start:261 stop:761 length:501 start_codon:yes stop_codon:yes gene_type:complete